MKDRKKYNMKKNVNFIFKIFHSVILKLWSYELMFPMHIQ